MTIDAAAIPAVPVEAQAAELQSLSHMGLGVFDQAALESNVFEQVGAALDRREQREDQRRLANVQRDISYAWELSGIIALTNAIDLFVPR